MTFDEFIKTYNGKKIDYDGVCGVQCVDLIKLYLLKCFNILPGSWGNAHAYFDNFNNISELKNNFTRIANTPKFVPQKGDIAVWGKSLNGNYGHIAICTGEGNTTYFYSYDQNWTGRHDACTKIKHNYSHFLGVLRPKPTAKKSIATIAQEVVAGKWGNGEERKQKLNQAGYNYEQVQKKVNELLK